MMKFKGEITPAKIMCLIVFVGSSLVAIELKSEWIGLAAIAFPILLYVSRKKIAQLMMKINENH